MADSVKDSFGFLPHGAYEDQANKGQLWLALDRHSDGILGYILFGGRFPHLKVFQLFVTSSLAKRGIGRCLFSELKQFAIDNNYLYVSAKVATDLPANKFWQRIGLRICDQIPAQGAKRAKNVYILELPTASLFHSGDTTPNEFEYKNDAQLRSLRFVLDLNIYFDAVKQRKYAEDALRVFQLGLTGRLKLAITEEFIKELKRNSPKDGNDPLLELASAIPQWPDIPTSAKNVLLEKLRADVFPKRSLTRKSFAQDNSDLTHLALCIHYGADGFITREGAILQKSELLRQKYGLDVISAADLLDTDLLNEADCDRLAIAGGPAPLLISNLPETDRSKANQFLEKFGVDRNKASQQLAPSDQRSQRHCWIAKSGEKIVGLLSNHQTDLDSTLSAFVYVDEGTLECDRIIDHFFQALESSQIPRKLRYIDLSMSARQPLTYETGFARGYRKTGEKHEAHTLRLGKWAFCGPLHHLDWSNFRDMFAKSTKLLLPNEMPSFSELQNTGLFVRNLAEKAGFSISLREFETMTSTFVVAAGRPSVIIPIRYGYARQLLGVTQRQRQLEFPQPEALIRSERAYFCHPPGPKNLRAGGVIIFYVSAHQGGNKAAVGIARVTSIQKLHASTVATSLGRQGVLDSTDLGRVSNNGGELVAMTFDNYFQFQKEVSWNTLVKLGCIGGANLVTSQDIDSQQLESILCAAYGA